MIRDTSKPLIVVTGATGFVGRHLIAALCESGFAVRACVRRRASGLSLPAADQYQIEDLTRVDWPEALHNADAIVHLAAMAHQSAPRTPADDQRVRAVNVEAVSQLTAAAAAVRIRRLVLLSSIGVLGSASEAGGFDAASQPAPHDFYSRSKLDAEYAATTAAANSPLELCIIRPPLVYGPDAPGNFGRMIRWVNRGIPLPLGAINNRRSLISVWNLCSFLLTCLTSPGAVGAPLLVADEQTISTPELLRLCASILGRPDRLLPIPPPMLRFAAAVLGRTPDLQRLCGTLVINTQETFRRTHWRAPLHLEDGLRRALQ